MGLTRAFRARVGLATHTPLPRDDRCCVPSAAAWWLRQLAAREEQSGGYGDSVACSRAFCLYETQSCFSKESSHVGQTAGSCPQIPKAHAEGSGRHLCPHRPRRPRGSAGSRGPAQLQSRLLFWAPRKTSGSGGPPGWAGVPPPQRGTSRPHSPRRPARRRAIPHLGDTSRHPWTPKSLAGVEAPRLRWICLSPSGVCLTAQSGALWASWPLGLPAARPRSRAGVRGQGR